MENFVDDQSLQDSILFWGFTQYHDIPPLPSVKLHTSGYFDFCSHFIWAWQNVASVSAPFLKTAAICLVPEI